MSFFLSGQAKITLETKTENRFCGISITREDDLIYNNFVIYSLKKRV